MTCRETLRLGSLARLGSFLALALLGFFGPRTLAVELTAGPEVDASAGPGRAVIRWQTDVVAGGRVQWGTQPGKLIQRAQGPTGTAHRIELQGLKPGTVYHFTVGTARYPLATNTFTTPGAAVSAPVVTHGSGVNAASAETQPQAPPARLTWGSMRTLRDHFERHGRDFGATDPDDYARRAWLFLQRGRTEGLPAKRDSEGVLRVYDPATRSFGAYNRDGTTRTFFKPGRRDYFQDQPGRPVDLREER